MMKIAMLVKSRSGVGMDAEEKALRFFDYLLNAWSGQELEPDDEAFMDGAMQKSVIICHRLGRMWLGGQSRTLR